MGGGGGGESRRGVVVGSWEYWVQWQVIVCGLIFILPTVIAVILLINRYKKKKKKTDTDTDTDPTGPLYSSDLWIPCWRNLNPLWLLFFRAFAFSSMSFLLFHIVSSFGLFVFYFYTQWSFVLVIIYFAFATIISARECWMYTTKPLPTNGGEQEQEQEQERDELLKKTLSTMTSSTSATGSKEIKGNIKLQSRSTNTNLEEIDQTPGFFESAMQTIYQTCAGAAILTDVVFWCLILPFLTDENFHLDLLIGSMHSVNAIFLILDSALNNLPFPWYRLAYFVLWSVGYVVFLWVLHACGSTWWPYPFLELSTPWAPLWYLGLGLVHIPCYGLYVMLIKAKSSIFSRMFPYAFGRNLVATRRNSLLEKKQA